MDLQAYVREQLAGKRIILVGNAPFTENCSRFIDDHDIVVRFNLFSCNGFAEGRSGHKFDYWFVNLDTGRKNNSKAKARKAALIEECARAKRLAPPPQLHCASAEDTHGRLGDAIRFYAAQGFELLWPDTHIECASPKEPSVGFYTACRILREHVPITVIGFTGKVSKHHDGNAELAFLQSHHLIKFARTPPPTEE